MPPRPCCKVGPPKLDESLFALHDVGSLAADLKLETWWRLGCDGYQGFLSNLLALECSLPEGVTWWQELRLRLDLALKNRAAEAVLRNTRAKEAWAKKMLSVAHACKHLKGPQSKQTSHLVDKDTGEITVVVSRMHDMLMKAWQPLFSMYATKPEPDWHDFAEEYAVELKDWHAACPASLPASALEHAVRTRGADKVGGTDGWTTAEGHLLPGVSFWARQTCLETVAHGSDWPPPLLFGTVPLLPKNDSGLPEDQRPLTCLSLWNVGWDKAIYAATKPWAGHTTTCCDAGRPCWGHDHGCCLGGCLVIGTCSLLLSGESRLPPRQREML